MDDGLSLSIFVIEVDLEPVLAFAAKKNSDAEIISQDERIRAKLCSEHSGGKPVCDDLAILRVRLARPEERAIYNDKARSMESGLKWSTYLRWTRSAKLKIDHPTPDLRWQAAPNCLVFFASDDASYLIGAVASVDCGIHAGVG